MKSTLIVCLVSANILVVALPSHPDGLSKREQLPEPLLLAARQNPTALTWTKPNFCTATTASGDFRNIFTMLQHPPQVSTLAAQSFDYSAFCSAVVQSTTIAWAQTTFSGVKTDTVTSTKTTSLSTTAVDNSIATTTALCPIPSPSMSCNISANGYYQNMLTYDFLPHAECHQLCLKNSDCRSFQVVPQDNGVLERCNLYNVSVAGNVDTNFRTTAVFWDRGCGDLLPTGCSATSPPLPTITPAPTHTAVAAAGIQKRAYTIPEYLSSMQLLYLPFVCSCLISAGPTPLTLTQTNAVQSWEYVTVVSTRTEVYSYTHYPEWRTVYTSVV
ncbi:uncharacterized protein PAC_15737 [Phialocephala subalpina]|uniref:Apple domain-containing protein n=1 Tax=Phialocephala subalpina TaxID=576137 RepID=A0A1L7XLL5_9HELO|nr:uncharacterized protein PAC_15737 [Phialocephala subalpina]